MKITSRTTVPYRRKRAGLTNYKKRLGLLKSGKYRFVVRKSLNNTLVQVVEYDPDGDKILISAHSSELKKFGWKGHTGNIPSAYLTGYLAGVKAQQKKIQEAIVDFGLFPSTKGSRLYATIKGAIAAGLALPANPDIFPTEGVIEGKFTKVKQSLPQIIKSMQGVQS